jgi:hypothetical protein
VAMLYPSSRWWGRIKELTGRSNYSFPPLALAPSPIELVIMHIVHPPLRGRIQVGGKTHHSAPPPSPSPVEGLTGGGKHPFPPVGGRWGWGKSTGSTPTRTLPHQGGGEVFEDDVHDVLPLSAIAGEGNGSQATHMKCLGLSVPNGGEGTDLPWCAWGCKTGLEFRS